MHLSIKQMLSSQFRCARGWDCQYLGVMGNANTEGQMGQYAVQLLTHMGRMRDIVLLEVG